MQCSFCEKETECRRVGDLQVCEGCMDDIAWQFLEEYEQRTQYEEEAMRLEEIANCQHDNVDHGICTNCEQAV